MLRKILTSGGLTAVLTAVSCGGGGGSTDTSGNQYLNPYAKVVNGEVVQQTTQSIGTTGYVVDGVDLSYISAFSVENGRLVYSASTINNDGTFSLKLKDELKYTFVLFDADKKPVLIVTDNTKNVIIVRDSGFLRIVIGVNGGQLTVMDVEADPTLELDEDPLFDDADGNLIPDFAEQDNDGDGYLDYDEDGDNIFDGIEDNDGDGYIDGDDDEDGDGLPDPIDDDDDNDGIPDEEDDDDD
ncbi:hypothetical protein [Persephonella sp.]